MARPMFAERKKTSSSRIQSTQRHTQAMKNVVDPFLRWYNEVFNLQDNLKKLGDVRPSSENILLQDNGFEVNEEMLYNILSADMQATSKLQSFHTFHVLPTIPPSIAERTDLHKRDFVYFYEQKTYSYKLNECCTERDGKRGTVARIKYSSRVEDVGDVEAYLASKNFVDTRNLCENLKDLTIMKNFLNNSDEFTNYDAACEHSGSSSRREINGKK